MFDVRPVNEAGDLDLEKIEKMKKVVTLIKEGESVEDRLKEIEKEIENEPVSDWRGVGSLEYFQKEKVDEKEFREKFLNSEEVKAEKFPPEKFRLVENVVFPKFRIKRPFSISATKMKRLIVFLKFGMMAVAAVFICNIIIHAMEIRKNGLVDGRTAMAEILAAKDSIKNGDFEKSYRQFNSAHEKLDQLSAQLDGLGGILVGVTKYIPYLSKVSSGSHLISAGNGISKIGILVSEILKNVDAIKKGNGQGNSISYLSLFRDNEADIKKIAALLESAQDDLDSVNVDDIPASERSQFIEMKQMLPEVNRTVAAFLGEEKIFNDILGGNGPRKYLFLFQNNQEARATGGFIGSYGLLDIFNGRVRNFFIDGIFNPDGQLHTRIVPPAPIQKISANWSLHDSNWFPDFPRSAEKAAWFYEKAGGPTVDGVITMTPTVMEKLLEVTGPIDMPEYGIVVDKDNFIREVQYQVEVDYDKELNKPKKILGDLAPKILDKILNMKSFSEMSKALNVMVESLNEKQILIYSKNPEIENILSDNGWSGEMLDTPKDYLSVINTNINGFKTDGVVSENLTHKAEIHPDGSVIDTLTIVRHHNGGDTPYEWWNKVNSDYMRVYVPKGATLLGAEGQTREVDSPPLDYDALGYARDPQVQAEEDSAQIDPETGTKIYDDGGKTVFANWVYVSPKETVTVKYTYLLPFKTKLDSLHVTDSYSLLVQKQSGSLGSSFSNEIYYPAAYKIIWQDPTDGVIRVDGRTQDEAGLKMETDLKTDKFFGIDFTQ